jgi:hypothetical protein
VLDVNLIGDRLAAGCTLMVFDGTLADGRRLALLTRHGGSMAGKVLRLTAPGQALVVIDGRLWWARRAPHRSPAYCSARSEEWEIVAGLA